LCMTCTPRQAAEKKYDFAFVLGGKRHVVLAVLQERCRKVLEELGHGILANLTFEIRGATPACRRSVPLDPSVRPARHWRCRNR
jgi:hypothetical protein